MQAQLSLAKQNFLNIEGTYRTRNSQKCTQTPVMIANKVFDSFPFLPLLPPPCRKVSAGLLNKQCKLFYHERPFRYQPTYSQSLSYLLTYVLHEYMKPLRCNSLCVNYKGPSYIIDNTFEFAYKSFATLFALKWEKNLWQKIISNASWSHRPIFKNLKQIYQICKGYV